MLLYYPRLRAADFLYPEQDGIPYGTFPERAGVEEVERIYEDALLFDFYGELLTERRKRVFEEAVMDDCSLAEVAEEEGITRQGVHDMVKRTREALLAYEEKLGLIGRSAEVGRKLDAVNDITDDKRVHALVEEIKDIL